MTPTTVTIWLAYYSDGSEVAVFGDFDMEDGDETLSIFLSLL